MSGPDDQKVLCIIRDLVDTQSMGRKQTLNLPASTSQSSAAKEITKLCGYVQGTVSVRYEQQSGDTLTNVSTCSQQEKYSACYFFSFFKSNITLISKEIPVAISA